jgi:thiosulfate/3-mercaptopyruvate sulfurtransferase
MSGPVLTSPLVSTQWLADYLGSDQLVIVDASVIPYKQPNGRPGFLSGHEQYLAAGHIPGAVFADLISRFSDPEAELPFTHSTAEAFAVAAGELGIDNETTVVVYDAAVGQWASRLWWLFRTFGYDRVAVLDGGYTKWIAETRATEVGHVEPTPATFAAFEHPEFWASREDVESIVAGDAEAALVCGLPPKEFAGEEGPRARLGHIPGSISAPAGRLVDRETNAFLPEEHLRRILEPALGQKRVIAYCAAGIAASADALALTVLGAGNVVIYDGSLNEWANDESLPLATVAS